MLDNHIEREIFKTAIKKLTFTNCIPLFTLCDLAFAKESFDKYGEEIAEGVVGDDYVNNERRYGNILQRLCVNKDLDLSFKKLLAEPKVYDQYMLEIQVELYNVLASKISYPSIDVILPIHMLDKLSFVDDITTLYPYYPDKNREGCNFIECILLLTIRLSLRGRSLFTLDKKPESYYDKKRVVDMVNKLTENMKSEQMFKLFVYAFFNIIDEITYKKHRELAEKSLRLAWLPDDLKNRIDVFDTFERYKERYIKNLDRDYTEWQMHSKMVSENSKESKEACDCVFDFFNIDTIACELLPIAFNILTGREKRTTGSRKKNKLAKEYAGIIRKYIEQVIKGNINILNKLYIENLEI